MTREQNDNELKLQRATAGFSLIELMVVIAFIGVLAAIAAPPLRDWMKNADLSADTRMVYSTLQHVRNEAVTRNTTCTLIRNQVVAGNCQDGFGTPSPPGQPYDFVAYIDQDANGAFTEGEQIICANLSDNVIAAPDPAWVPTFAPNNMPAPGPADTLTPVTFNNRGLPNTSGTIVLQGATGRAFSIVLRNTGSLRIQ